MACEDCENKFPDRTVDQNCSDGIGDAGLVSNQESAVAPTTIGLDGIVGVQAISSVSNVVRNISKRFGKVQPGIYLTDEQANSLNLEIGVIFEDLESNMESIVNQITQRSEELNNHVKNKSDDCKNLFDGFEIEVPFGMDWMNPIAFSTKPKLGVGTCRINLGCQFCDFPGDINIPPFPGIPSCNFVEEFDEICGADFLNPFATVQNVVNGFQLFTTQVGQFAYAFFDLVNLATGFLGRCIMRILNCLGKFFADLNFDQALNTIGARTRETLAATNAILLSTFAKLNTIFITIQEIIKSALFELFRFIQDVLTLCDPCKLTQAILNPATIPEIPSFGGLLD
ncbi:MAG TPA: hypothetical protein DCX27_17120 [Balneola sp.]|nr:hypothetical protein [Balneola sp.]|tara:strand:+ start:1017 stop:2039 length:1023 start_codon:yes stop_codon:yes gene_type:complete